MSETMIYILIIIVVTNLVRVLPLILIKGEIKNTFIRSFLYYVPYVTLAVMTFPAIVEATSVPLAGFLALIIGIAAAYFGLGLFPVAVISCLTVLITEFIV